MTITHAAKYLKTNKLNVKRLVKEKKIRIIADGTLNSEDVEILKLEWEERKKISRPIWINQGAVI